MKERLCVEEQLFRADVEERLFRAVSASAFDCRLQPRPALKGIHPPAVAEPAPEKMGQPAEGCEHWIAQVAGQ